VGRATCAGAPRGRWLRAEGRRVKEKQSLLVIAAFGASTRTFPPGETGHGGGHGAAQPLLPTGALALLFSTARTAPFSLRRRTGGSACRTPFASSSARFACSKDNKAAACQRQPFPDQRRTSFRGRNVYSSGGSRGSGCVCVCSAQPASPRERAGCQSGAVRHAACRLKYLDRCQCTYLFVRAQLLGCQVCIDHQVSVLPPPPNLTQAMPLRAFPRETEQGDEQDT
jgi:hypothetical protein